MSRERITDVQPKVPPLDAETFIKWREKHFLTREIAAAALGVSRQTVWRWEMGRVPTPEWLAIRVWRELRPKRFGADRW